MPTLIHRTVNGHLMGGGSFISNCGVTPFFFFPSPLFLSLPLKVAPEIRQRGLGLIEFVVF